MKPFSKPISTSNRTEEFPPPLVRFLRSNGGSRSGGRSRSSPMFVRDKNDGIETQEPASPKVNCMGQVRVRKSKQAEPKSGSTSSAADLKCRWIRKALNCNLFIRKPKQCTSLFSCPRWYVVFQLGFRRKVETMEESTRRESKQEETDDVDEDGEANGVFASLSPKNALLLIRSRSAPYRASSLANRFWGSPCGSEDAGEEKAERVHINHGEDEEKEDDNHTLEPEPNCEDSDAKSRIDSEFREKLVSDPGFVGSSGERTTQATKPKDESLKIGVATVAEPDRPLKLTRCKSEPTRRSGELDP